MKNLIKVKNMHGDDLYYFCSNYESIIQVSQYAYQHLRKNGSIREIDMPKDDKFNGITDEMIEQAPFEKFKESLRVIQKMREVWVNGDASNSDSYAYHENLYKLFLNAEEGECESAYILLKNLDLIKEIDYIEMG